MNKTYGMLLMAIATLGSGCASIVGGHTQNVAVETRSKQGDAVLGANCTLSNSKGTWSVTTPGSVGVGRSFNDMIVNCDKSGLAPGIANVKSSTKALAFGNIIFGGVIGAGVDIASGAAYDYPAVVTVMMGETVTIDAPAAANAATAQPIAPSNSVAATAPVSEPKP